MRISSILVYFISKHLKIENFRFFLYCMSSKHLNLIIIKMMLKSKFFFSTIKQKILENSFKNVNKYGWNDKAILATC